LRHVKFNNFFYNVAQYDTQVEEAFIASAIQQREVNSVLQQQSEPPVTAVTPVAAASSPTEATEAAAPSVDPVPVPNPAPVQDVSNQSGQGHSAFRLIKESSILTPTPVATTMAGGSLAKGSGSGLALRNIDLKDFETEQDPFENLSLRVINDREELNKVFHVAPSQQAQSAAAETTAPTAATKPSHSVNSSNPSLLQYGASNVANGLNTASLNWIRCQPVPRWPFADHNTSSPTVAQKQAPYPVSGPFANRANVLPPGASYSQSSNFQPPQQSAGMSMLRSAKSTPDISKLVHEHAVVSARRTPPPVSSDWSTTLDSESREKVRFLCLFVFFYTD